MKNVETIVHSLYQLWKAIVEHEPLVANELCRLRYCWMERELYVCPSNTRECISKRENENQETGECLSDDKSIHILLLNSLVRENTRYSRKNAFELHKSSLVFFLFVCFFFPLSFGHVHGKISRYSWCTMSLRSVFRDRKSGVYISV